MKGKVNQLDEIHAFCFVSNKSLSRCGVGTIFISSLPYFGVVYYILLDED